MNENEAVPEGPVAEILSELRAANNAQGEAKAFVHIAGYAFKLGFDKLKWLLKEDRWRQCGFENLPAFAESIQFGPSMRAAAEDRRELTALFKAADEEKPLSNRKIATALNVHPSTIDRDTAAFAAIDEKTLNKNKEENLANAANAAPSLPSGERAGSLIAAREGRKARDAVHFRENGKIRAPKSRVSPGDTLLR
jgi:hypothetical protein